MIFGGSQPASLPGWVARSPLGAIVGRPRPARSPSVVYWRNPDQYSTGKYRCQSQREYFIIRSEEGFSPFAPVLAHVQCILSVFKRAVSMSGRRPLSGVLYEGRALNSSTVSGRKGSIVLTGEVGTGRRPCSKPAITWAVHRVQLHLQFAHQHRPVLRDDRLDLNFPAPERENRGCSPQPVLVGRPERGTRVDRR